MPDIRSSVRGLFRDLRVAKIDYVLVGGVALLAYVEGRNTQDIDLIIEPKQMGFLPWQARIQDRDFGTANYHGVQVDLRLTTNQLFAHVRRHDSNSHFGEDVGKGSASAGCFGSRMGNIHRKFIWLRYPVETAQRIIGKMRIAGVTSEPRLRLRT